MIFRGDIFEEAGFITNNVAVKKQFEEEKHGEKDELLKLKNIEISSEGPNSGGVLLLNIEIAFLHGSLKTPSFVMPWQRRQTRR